MPVYVVIHKVIRKRDGKHVGDIVATWEGDGSGERFPGGVPHGGYLVQCYRFSGRVTQGALEYFRWDCTTGALAAADKYDFQPSPF